MNLFMIEIIKPGIQSINMELTEMKINEMITAREMIDNGFMRFVEKDFFKRLSQTIKPDDKASITKVYGMFVQYIGKQKNRDNLIGCLKTSYGKRDIYEKMDNNEYLFAFKNGVFDLKTGEFRNAKPEELITTTMGYDYRKPKAKFVERLRNADK